MNTRLQELTAKIYNEGIEKANVEADNILANAKTQEARLIKEAQQKAEQIIAEANKKASELKEATQREIKLASQQAITTIRQEITNIISDRNIGEAVGKSFNNETFVKEIIASLINNWKPVNNSFDIDILLPSNKKEEMADALKSSVKQALDQGLTFKPSQLVENGFQLAPKDGSYKISFTDKDFANFFKAYLRPKLVELLFEEK
ncbi:MAG: DUF1387 domain-containing protein [Bacteroidales bacterium]|nr:DUF1387 domain-containing protein [Bacteroidales bacterium]